MMCGTCVYELCMCWAVGLRKGATFRWWRGCADLAKTIALKLAVITEEQDEQPQLKVWLTWLEIDFQGCKVYMLSSLSFSTSWLGKWSFVIQILKAIYVWSRHSDRRPCPLRKHFRESGKMRTTPNDLQYGLTASGNYTNLMNNKICSD